MNRQIISNLGITRENIHYNTSTEFYPLAELIRQDDSELNTHLDNETLDHFKTIMLQRKKRQKYSNKAKVPQYTEKAIVFMRDMIPSGSNILKIPQRGPFQITNIDERNVTLVEPETGQTVHTHIELIRPIDLKEFKLLLNKKWDLNIHHQKSIDRRTQPGIFDEPSNPIPLVDITDEIPLKEIKSEPKDELLDEIDLEQLFYPPPANITKSDQPTESVNPLTETQKNLPADALINPLIKQHKLNHDNMSLEKTKDETQPNVVMDEIIDGHLAHKPISPDTQHLTDEFDQTESNSTSSQNQLSQINSLHAFRDLSKPFKDTLKTKKEKMITFFLSKKDQYIKLPSGETEVD